MMKYKRRGRSLTSVKKKGTVPFLLLVLVVGVCGVARGNNIKLSTPTVKGGLGDDGRVSFDVSWDNSWRLDRAGVRDAAWVFVKFRKDGAGNWNHLKLKDSGYRAPSGSELVFGRPDENNVYDATSNPYVGAFIQRDTNGSGEVNFTGVELAFNLEHNNLVSTNTITVRVFGIEMVYVAEGAFAAGDGQTDASQFTLTTINTGDATVAPSGTGGFSGSAQGGYPTGQTAPANAVWPNGYNAFYMMKYSITQKQYVDFLNTLTRTQQEARLFTTTVNNFMHSGGVQTTPINRNGVRLVSDPLSPNPRVYANDLNTSNASNSSDDGQRIACNWMSWMDGAAYAAWAGLRPFTELEYEKACRGPVTPVPDEYAWGDATTITAATGINSGGASNETATPAGANACYGNSGTGGPIRVGIFATGSSNRIQAGASYWGIMELSGNNWERPVTVGNADGRGFTGLHGNGTVSAAGHATVSSWPGLSSGEVTAAGGSGFRGGAWDSLTGYLRVSGRSSAAGTYAGRSNVSGFRAARSLPVPAGD